MTAYRTPDGRDPGRLLHDFRPSDSSRVTAAIVLTLSALLGIYSLIRPPRTSGHVVMLIAAGTWSFAAIVQLLFENPPRPRSPWTS